MAEMAGIRIPAKCRQGDCSACVARLVSKRVDQNEQKFLSPSEIEAGNTVIKNKSSINRLFTRKTRQFRIPVQHSCLNPA